MSSGRSFLVGSSGTSICKRYDEEGVCRVPVEYPELETVIIQEYSIGEEFLGMFIDLEDSARDSSGTVDSGKTYFSQECQFHDKVQKQYGTFDIYSASMKNQKATLQRVLVTLH